MASAPGLHWFRLVLARRLHDGITLTLLMYLLALLLPDLFSGFLITTQWRAWPYHVLVVVLLC